MGGRDFCLWVSLRELWRSSHMLVSVLEYVLELRTVRMSQNLTRRLTEELMLCLWKAHVDDRKVIKTLFWEKERNLKSDTTTWFHVGPEQWKEKANWKQSVFFQLVWFHLVALVFLHRWRFWWRGTGEPRAAARGCAWCRHPATLQLLWGLAGDGVTAWDTLPPRDLLRLPETSDAAEGRDQIRSAEALKEEVIWIMACWQDMMERFLSQRRAIMDCPPLSLPYEVLKPFLIDYPLLHLHLLYSASLFRPVSFYKCVSYCFSFWFPLDLYRFSSFAFLFWCGLDCACSVFLKSWVQCLQDEFESSSSPPFWSDAVCVFINSLLLLNVRSVAFVQGGEVLAPVQLN